MSPTQTLLRLAKARQRTASLAKASVAIEGTEAIASSPEGKTASMPLDQLLAKVAPTRLSTGSVILPDGLKAVLTEGPVTIWIHETPPAPYHFEWIADDSPAPYGEGAKYRSVRITLPYVIIFAVFTRGPRGHLQLSAQNECFFRTAPLKNQEDELFFPALLNCSKFSNPEGHPLSWICTQHLKANGNMRSPDDNLRLRASFEALRHCLTETRWNYSSENHEGSSWFTESRKVDPRVQTIDAWQAASAQDPLFVLEVPWLKTGLNVDQMARRIFSYLKVNRRETASAAALARLIFNQ
jgi:hypothetical protein